MKSIVITAEEKEQAFRDLADLSHPAALAKITGPAFRALLVESNPHLATHPEFS